jgi:molybdate transport system permease protein
VNRRPPPLLLGLAALAVLLLVTPLVGLLLRTPWSALIDHLGTPGLWESLRLSLVTASLAAAVSVVLGTPLAWILARSALPGAWLLRALVTLPLVLPPVVGGTALLAAFGRRGLVDTGLPFTTAGVVVAEAFVALPFLVLTGDAALRGEDGHAEDTAATLGAGPLRTLWHVTLPAVRPSLVSGAVLAWGRALGEFGATVTFAGSLSGRTRTAPSEVVLLLESDPDAAVALSVTLVAVCLLLLLVLRRRWWPGLAFSR